MLLLLLLLHLLQQPQEVDCSSIANSAPNRTTNSCECIQPDHCIAAFDGTQLLQCLPSNTTSCPGSATLPVKTADGLSLIQCLVASSANTPCPSGYLTMYRGSPSVAAECRPEPASSQQKDYVCAASYAPFRVALQDGSKLAGCIDTGSSVGECPASAVKLTNGSSLTVCMRGLAACPGNYPYTTSLGSGALYGCSSVDIPMSITCWAGYVPVINADGSTVDCIMDGQACPQSHPVAARRVSSGTAQVAKCMPQLQTCPANFNFPFYSFDSASSTLSISSCWETDMKSSCGNRGSNPGDQYDTAITDRSSGVTIGCVQNGATSCPASFPEASFSSGKLAGCKAARNCYFEDAVEMVDGAGKVVDCWPLSDKKPCPEGYISLWSGYNTLARCLASSNAQGAAAACPSGYQFPLYGESSAGSFTLRACWIDGGIHDCSSVAKSSPITGDHGVSLWNGTSQLEGCLAGNATGCPGAWQYATHLVDGSLLSCSSENVGKPVVCRNATDVELLGVDGTVVGCIAPDAECPAAFNITARDGGSGQRIACLATGQSACPDAFRYPYYTPSAYSSVVISHCWREATGVVASCNQTMADGMYTVPVKSDGSAGAATVGCVKKNTLACPDSALMINSNTDVLSCVRGLSDCSTTVDANGVKAYPVWDLGQVVGCGFGICPNDFIVTVYGSLDDAVNDPKGCLSTRSQCSQGLGGHNFNLFGALGDLELCIQSPESSGSTSCSDVPGYEGLQLVDSSGGWVGCTADTICPEQFPQRTQDGASCQEASASGRRRLRR